MIFLTLGDRIFIMERRLVPRRKFCPSCKKYHSLAHASKNLYVLVLWKKVASALEWIRRLGRCRGFYWLLNTRAVASLSGLEEHTLLLTLMLRVANLTNTKWGKNPWEITETSLKQWQMGTHLKVLNESYPMNTNMTWFRWFSKIFVYLCFGRK